MDLCDTMVAPDRYGGASRTQVARARSPRQCQWPVRVRLKEPAHVATSGSHAMCVLFLSITPRATDDARQPRGRGAFSIFHWLQYVPRGRAPLTL